ncbi:MAG: hypothetical protein EBR23_04960, partial [Planctomycetia bacterium]|nr:hypothetical protein [Planctomycetia bacterium]
MSRPRPPLHAGERPPGAGRLCWKEDRLAAAVHEGRHEFRVPARGQIALPEQQGRFVPGGADQARQIDHVGLGPLVLAGRDARHEFEHAAGGRVLGHD